MEKKTIGIASFVFVAILAVSLVSAFGLGDGLNKPSEEQRDAMRTAVENNDYSAWKSLMEERVETIKASITEENFNERIIRHQERLEQGFGEGQRKLDGSGKGMGKGEGRNHAECPYTD